MAFQASFLVGLGVAAITLITLALMLRSRKVGNAAVPQPLKQLDLERCVGKWYELARYENRFQRGRDNVTVYCEIRAFDRVEVIALGWKNGAVLRFKCRAKPLSSEGNKLKVSSFGLFRPGQYWILDRGDRYDWTIVGEPTGAYLWILTREPQVPAGLQARLVKQVETLGYDTTRLRFTSHRGAE